MRRHAVGIDLGGTNIKAALVEQDSGIVHRASVPTPTTAGPDAVLEAVVSLVMTMSRGGLVPVAGIGLGSPGTINWEQTSVSYPPNLPGWTVVNVAEELRVRLGTPSLPIFVENDANVAGLGSAHYGAGVPHDSFIMVTLGTGVGGAIIYKNRIFRGSTGGAGEIGHMSIDYEGPLARSGIAGAIEAYVGQTFLSEYARRRLLGEPDAQLHKRAGPQLLDLTPRMLYEAANDGDTLAREILAWAGHKLGCVLGSAVNLLDIRKIVVGGGVSGAGDYILESTRRTLPRYVVPGLREGLEVILEERGNDVGLAGAAHLVFQNTEN